MRDTPVELNGVVVDAQGSPLAEVEVAICPRRSPCSWLVEELALSNETTSALVTDEVRDGITIVRTSQDGSWSYRGVFREGELVIGHPGFQTYRSLGSDGRIVLRRAAQLRLNPRCPEPDLCDRASVALRCNEETELARVAVGSHPTPITLWRLAPGSCIAQLSTRSGEPGERRGSEAIALVAGELAEVTVDLEPTGTGHTIEGQLGSAVREAGRVAVFAECADGVRRSVTVSTGEAYRLEDVGSAPCEVGAEGVRLCARPTAVDELPATLDLQVRVCASP